MILTIILICIALYIGLKMFDVIVALIGKVIPFFVIGFFGYILYSVFF